MVRRVGSVSIMDAYVLKCQHRSETFGASGMGEKGEHSGWTKLRNSRLCIYMVDGHFFIYLYYLHMFNQ